MIQKNEVINPKCSSTICATTSSFSFKRLQKPSKWRSFRTHSFFLAPRLVPGQPPPDLRGSKSSFHHAMQVWVGSSNLKKESCITTSNTCYLCQQEHMFGSCHWWLPLTQLTKVASKKDQSGQERNQQVRHVLTHACF